MAHNKLSMYKTAIVESANGLSVVYHKTPIVSKNANGDITLNSGGYESVTTKKKMNQAANQFGLGFGVFQKNYVWYVTYKGQTLEFYDGIKLAA